MVNGIRERIHWIDIAKGVAILLMIVGHGPRSSQLVTHFIYSFHMPLFIILSGYTFKNLSIKSTVKKSAKSLLLPYIMMCIVIGGLFFIVNYFHMDFTYAYQQGPLNLSEYVKMCLYAGAADESFLGGIRAIGVIWFLMCLFWAKVYMTIIYNITESDTNRFLCVMLLLILGELLARYNIRLPLDMDIACVAVFFLYVGMCWKNYDLSNVDNKVFILCIVVEVLFLMRNECLSLGGRNYFMLPGFLAATSSSLLICRLCIELEKQNNIISKFLRFCGENSLIILCMHKIEGMLFVLYSLKLADKMRWGGSLEIAIFRISIAVLLTVVWINIKKMLKRVA